MWSSTQIRPGIWAGFTDVTAGNLAFHVGDDPLYVKGSRAAVNAKLASETGQSVELAYMNQVHGRAVAQLRNGTFTIDGVNPESDDGFPTADAMVAVGHESTSAGLAVMVADCVPVILMGHARDGSAIIAVAHAGRPGVERGVLSATVAHMRTAGAQNIEAWLGPSVCGRCYEVPEEMRATVAEQIPEAWATTSWRTAALDLPAAALAQLERLKVRAHASGICTMEDELYYSHRRSQRDGHAEGRFIGFVLAESQHAAMAGSR